MDTEEKSILIPREHCSEYKKYMYKALRDITVLVYGTTNKLDPLWTIAGTTSGGSVLSFLTTNVFAGYITVQDIGKYIFKRLDKVDAFSDIPKMVLRGLKVQELRNYVSREDDLQGRRNILKMLFRLFENDRILANKSVRQEDIMYGLIKNVVPDLYKCYAYYEEEKDEAKLVSKYYSLKGDASFIFYVNTHKIVSYLQFLLLPMAHKDTNFIKIMNNNKFNEVLMSFRILNMTTASSLAESRKKTRELFSRV